MSSARGRLALLSFLALGIAPPASAQGDFVNFETPSVKPIDVAKIGSAWYVLVCNTADNAVEVFTTATNTPVLRVAVGQNPVTVRWNANHGAFYTCNWIGDSVTKVALTQGSGSTPLVATVLATRHVGDEPADLVFRGDNSSFLVTLSSRSAFVRVDAATLLPLGPEQRLGNSAASSLHSKALDQPRRIVRALTQPVVGERFYAMGTRNRTSSAGTFAFDVLVFDLDAAGNVVATNPLSSAGSSAFGLAQSSDGRLWGVGNFAEIATAGESALRIRPTGFVKSQLFAFDDPSVPLAAPAVRDLNLSAGPPSSPTTTHQHSVPTDLAVLERNGQVRTIFVASFQTDRIGVVTVNGQPSSQAASWTIGSVDLRPALTSGYSVVGPRAFALKPYDASVPGDPSARLYVANTLMPSYSVFDPNFVTPGVTTVPLQNDPTPATIRLGRRGLYDARVSGGGFVSCASCHLDAGTDGLPWKLEIGSGATIPIPPNLLGDGLPSAVTHYPDDKGPLVTQNLHGLVNHHVPGASQKSFTNEPYHWRGDRSDFLAFHGAFTNLLGMQNPNLFTPQDMVLFRDFIDTCVYPPNPEQSLDRVVQGDMGPADDQLTGNGPAWGQKLFHIIGIPGAKFRNQSCTHCHAGVSGSNSRLTDQNGPQGGQLQPLESAALRNLSSREAQLERDLVPNQTVSTGDFGLQHEGLAKSIDTFHKGIFTPFYTPTQLAAVIAFTRAFDTGIAPVVGRTFTVTSANATSSEVVGAFRLAVNQALAANAGVAAYARIGGVETRYWLDTRVFPPLFHVEGGAATISVTALRTSPVASGDVVIVQSTPIGSERRIASANGAATPIVDLANPPTNVALEPMKVPTQWEGVTAQTTNANPAPPTPLVKGRFLQTLQVYRQALGLPTKHDAPRRFRVSGDHIRPGAVLELGLPLAAPPTSNVSLLTLPIFPTSERTAAGKVIWSSSAEIDPIFCYQLMLGGKAAPDVQAAFDAQNPELGTWAFDPNWRTLRVVVRNEDGTSNAATPLWQALSLL